MFSLAFIPNLRAITRNYSKKILEIGGMPDPVPLLVELSSVDRFSEFIREIKSSSSLWIHKNFPNLNDLAWQEGDGSFSVSYSALAGIQKYTPSTSKL